MIETTIYTIPHHESEKVEFKTSFQDEVIVSLVAFAKAKGGAVYVGVNDKGVAKGVSIGEKTVQKWLNEIKVKTQPPISGSDRVTDKVTDRVTDNQQKILTAITKDIYITTAILADMVGISQRKIKDNIQTLKEKGLLERIGPAKGGYWKVL